MLVVYDQKIVRGRYLSRMKNEEYFYSPETCFGWCNATGYHPGPVAPPCADGAPLLNWSVERFHSEGMLGPL